MTNEEKANEIAMPCQGCECEWTKEKMYKQQYCKDCVAQDKFIAAIEAMEWKDEQIDTIMLTTEGCLRSFFESQGNTQESIDNFIDALKTQINENLNKL